MPTVPVCELDRINPRVATLQHAIAHPDSVPETFSGLYRLICSALYTTAVDPGAIVTCNDKFWDQVRGLIRSRLRDDPVGAERLLGVVEKKVTKIRETQAQRYRSPSPGGNGDVSPPQGGHGLDLLRFGLPPEIQTQVITTILHEFVGKTITNYNSGSNTEYMWGPEWFLQILPSKTAIEHVRWHDEFRRREVIITQALAQLYAFGGKFRDPKTDMYEVARLFFNLKFCFASFTYLQYFINAFGHIDDLGNKKITSRAHLLRNFSVSCIGDADALLGPLGPYAQQFSTFNTLLEARNESTMLFKWAFSSDNVTRLGCASRDDYTGMLYLRYQIDATDGIPDASSAGIAKVRQLTTRDTRADAVGIHVWWDHHFANDTRMLAEAAEIINRPSDAVVVIAMPLEQCSPDVKHLHPGLAACCVYSSGSTATGGRDWVEVKGGRGIGTWQYEAI